MKTKLFLLRFISISILFLIFVFPIYLQFFKNIEAIGLLSIPIFILEFILFIFRFQEGSDFPVNHDNVKIYCYFFGHKPIIFKKHNHLKHKEHWSAESKCLRCGIKSHSIPLIYDNYSDF
jgi:hypothetical protein